MKINFSTFIPIFVFLLMFAFQMGYAQSVKKIPPREASLINHLVKEANQPNYHSKGDAYLLVRIGKTEYIAELKSGKVVTQRNARFTGGGVCGDYAEVGISLLNKNKKETTQGAGQVLKRSGAGWVRIALAESDYSCEDLRGISQSIMKCLKIECF
jgi:hypothetical protein